MGGMPGPRFVPRIAKKVAKSCKRVAKSRKKLQKVTEIAVFACFWLMLAPGHQRIRRPGWNRWADLAPSRRPTTILLARTSPVGRSSARSSPCRTAWLAPVKDWPVPDFQPGKQSVHHLTLAHSAHVGWAFSYIILGDSEGRLQQ